MALVRTLKGAAKGWTVSLTVIVVEGYNKPYFASNERHFKGAAEGWTVSLAAIVVEVESYR